MSDLGKGHLVSQGHTLVWQCETLVTLTPDYITSPASNTKLAAGVTN